MTLVPYIKWYKIYYNTIEFIKKNDFQVNEASEPNQPLNNNESHNSNDEKSTNYNMKVQNNMQLGEYRRLPCCARI